MGKNMLSSNTALVVLLGLAIFTLLSIVYSSAPELSMPTTIAIVFIIAAFPFAYALSRVGEGILRAVFAFFAISFIAGQPFPFMSNVLLAESSEALLYPPAWMALLIAGVMIFYPFLKIREHISFRAILILTGPAMLIYHFAAMYAIGRLGIPAEGHILAIILLYFWALTATFTGILMKREAETGGGMKWFFELTKSKLLAALAICILAILFIILLSAKNSLIASIMFFIFAVGLLPLIFLVLYVWRLLEIIGLSAPLGALIYKSGLMSIVPAIIVIIYIYMLICVVSSLIEGIRTRLT